MLHIDVQEFRRNIGTFLERAKAGQTVEITELGVPVARLVPAPSARDRLVAEGTLIPAAGPRRLPQRMSVDGPSTAEVLDELREDRL